MKFVPVDSDFEQKIRRSFDDQAVMKLIGADLCRVEPGRIDIRLPYRQDLTQQDGFIHAGVIATVADSACGYAAYSLMPAGSAVLSVEFKQNLVSPAVGDYFVAEGRIIRRGKTLTVSRSKVYAWAKNERKLVGIMLATMIRVESER